MKKFVHFLFLIKLLTISNCDDVNGLVFNLIADISKTLFIPPPNVVSLLCKNKGKIKVFHFY